MRVGGPGMVTTFAPETNIPASNQVMFAVMGASFPTYAADVASGEIGAFRDGRSNGGLALAQSLGRDMSSLEEKFEGTSTQTSDSALRIDIELDNGYSLHSVTGRNKYDYEDGMDADWLPVSFVGRSDISDYSQTSQEFRIASPADRDFSFVAGGYWSKGAKH